MWRCLVSRAVLPVALAVMAGSVALAQETTTGWDPIVTPETGVSTQGGLDFRSSMNFTDCAAVSAKKLYDSECGWRKCEGKVTPHFSYTYSEPVVMVEVSCRPGKSHVMESAPSVITQTLGRTLSKPMQAAMRSKESKCMESDKAGTPNYFFNARAFGITLTDRMYAATENSRKLRAAKWSMLCDLLPVAGSVAGVLGIDLNALQTSLTGGAVPGLDLGGIIETYGQGDLGSMTGMSMLEGANVFDLALSGGDIGSIIDPVTGNLTAPVTEMLGNIGDGLGATLGFGGGEGGWETTVTEAGGSSGGWQTTVTPAGGMSANVVDANKAKEMANQAMDVAAVLGCSPWSLPMGALANIWQYGLIPLFVSDVAVPCWTVRNPLDVRAMAAEPMRVGANISTGGLLSAACASTSAMEDFMPGFTGGFGEQVDKATLGLSSSGCVGNWGDKAPDVGYASNRIRPVSAALVGYRAYDLATKINAKQYKNKRGKLKFNMDYPYINDGMMSPFLSSVMLGKGSHGHKGSGCYNPGTPDPRWYTAGESYLPDPSKALLDSFNDLKSMASGNTIKTNNGDYVFTYWKNTKCCIPYACPWKAKKK